MGAYGRTPLDETSGVDRPRRGPLAGVQATFGGDGRRRQPRRRGGRVPGDERRPPGRRVPAVRQRTGGRATSTPSDRSSPSRANFAGGVPHRRQLHAPGPHVRPVRHRGADAPRSRRSSPTPPKRATTTSSWRPTSSVRTTGRRSPRSVGDHRRRPRRVRGRLPARPPSLAGALPHPRETPASRTVRPATGTRSPARRTGGPRWRSTGRLRRQQVELVVSYVTDPFTGENGLAVDDTRIVTKPARRTRTASRTASARGHCWSARGQPARTQNFEVRPASAASPRR